MTTIQRDDLCPDCGHAEDDHRQDRRDECGLCACGHGPHQNHYQMRASHEDAVTAAYARAGVLPLLPLDDPQLAEVARSFAARDAESVTAHERGYEIRMVAALERAEKWETKAKELAATIVRERGERDLLKHRVAELEQELAVESERRRKAIDERDREREIAHALKRRLDYATAGPGDHV